MKETMEYQNTDDLEINTLENVLYIGMKNDISFLIGYTMNLYEHQSSQNENMPLLGLLYLAKLYEVYVTEQGLNIYSNEFRNLPTPRYIVFYNGENSTGYFDKTKGVGARSGIVNI